jgi:hypothetical protein
LEPPPIRCRAGNQLGDSFLIPRADPVNGLRVATVGLDDNVLFKTVTIARDLGRDIELESGISLDDRIITAPPDGISDGDRVRTVGAYAARSITFDPRNVLGV